MKIAVRLVVCVLFRVSEQHPNIPTMARQLLLTPTSNIPKLSKYLFRKPVSKALVKGTFLLETIVRKGTSGKDENQTSLLSALHHSLTVHWNWFGDSSRREQCKQALGSCCVPRWSDQLVWSALVGTSGSKCWSDWQLVSNHQLNKERAASTTDQHLTILGLTSFEHWFQWRELGKTRVSNDRIQRNAVNHWSPALQLQTRNQGVRLKIQLIKSPDAHFYLYSQNLLQYSYIRWRYQHCIRSLTYRKFFIWCPHWTFSHTCHCWTVDCAINLTLI